MLKINQDQIQQWTLPSYEDRYKQAMLTSGLGLQAASNAVKGMNQAGVFKGIGDAIVRYSDQSQEKQDQLKEDERKFNQINAQRRAEGKPEISKEDYASGNYVPFEDENKSSTDDDDLFKQFNAARRSAGKPELTRDEFNQYFNGGSND